jgi:hypothetical protein
MPSPAVPLYRVLVDEYKHQGLQPPFPEPELDAAFAKRRPELEEKLRDLRDADADEYERQLDAERVKDFYAWLHKNRVQRSALCFSGGGIRSATFGLGLVQGLARRRLLGCFHYLSTVSGGGYLGSWLTGWIYHERERLQKEGRDPDGALAEVESRLHDRPQSPLEPEPEPLRYLRRYSRYMSPKVGLLSADTWTLVAIFIRNLFLNWLVFLPLLAAALVVPRISVILVRLGTRPWFQAHQQSALQAVFWAAVLLGSCAIAYISVNRPSLADRSTFPRLLRKQGWFLALCLTPLALMSILITLYWAWVRSAGTPLSGLSFVILGREASPLFAFALFGVLLHVGGFAISRIWVRVHILGEITIVVLTGALGGALTWLAAESLFPAVGSALATEVYVCCAAPLLLFLFLVAATLFVGLSSYFTTDADREWLARAGAWILIFITVRVAFSAIVIFGPVAVLRFVVWVSSIGGVSGLLTLFLGRSARTKGEKDGQEQGKRSLTSILLDKLLTLAAPIFAASILVMLSLGTTVLVKWLAGVCYPGYVWPPVREVAADPWGWPLSVVYYSPWKPVVAVLAILALTGVIMGFFVDINRFSLHAAYRDRLIRAYLGASRGEARRPNPFTGFDDDDNILMRPLRGNRPFHVVNMALNLVGGQDLAWQDRKAETFTVSPLHAGSFRLGYRDAAEYGHHRKKEPDIAISLGTAVAISGAAASPNMGYHSSPVVTFLLALFNVRLGWWLGNPGPHGDRTYNTPGPRFAPRPFFAEAFGLTDSRHPYVYLSDGGHFENLGLYEMILRRCHFIVVSDGGQDPDFSFEDLGNALAKIRVDLGVPIEFEKILIRRRPPDQETYDASRSRAAAHSTQPYCAIARICYSWVDGGAGEGTDGMLLYIKPSLNGTEPADVFHYARLHPEFPHEPTSDQLYSESQFESYRELGAHVMATILDKVAEGATLEDLFRQIGEELGNPPACA